jgi:hypothetical protein
VKQSIFTLLLTLLFYSSYACSCNDAGNFRKASKQAALVAVIDVLAYEDYFSMPPYDSLQRPMSVRVKIIKLLQGKEIKQEVKIFGDNGFLCRESIRSLLPGKSYVVALHRAENRTWEFGVKETDQDYILSSCGEFLLQFDPVRSNVYGRILEGRKRNKWMDFPTFEATLEK